MYIHIVLPVLEAVGPQAARTGIAADTAPAAATFAISTHISNFTPRKRQARKMIRTRDVPFDSGDAQEGGLAAAGTALSAGTSMGTAVAAGAAVRIAVDMEAAAEAAAAVRIEVDREAAAAAAGHTEAGILVVGADIPVVGAGILRVAVGATDILEAGILEAADLEVRGSCLASAAALAARDSCRALEARRILDAWRR